MSEFDGIEDYEGWSAKLGELLTEAEGIAQEGLEPRLNLSRRFMDFIIHSHPATPEIRMLDELADRARESLLLATIDERIAAISNRNSELIRLTKTFREKTASANATAASLRLEQTNRTVNVLTESLQEIRALKDTLDSVADADLITKIEKAVASIRKLRDSFEDIAG